MKKKNSKTIRSRRFINLRYLIILLVAIPLLILSGSYYLSSDKSLKKDKTLIKFAIVSSVPNFDNLSLRDLPDLRSLGQNYTIDGYEYKNNIILAGDHLLEYNPRTNQVLRTINPKILPCTNGGVVVEEKFYNVCENNYGNLKGDDYEVTQRILYVVDLNTGSIVTRYIDDKLRVFVDFIDLPVEQQVKGNLINASLAVEGKNVWIGNWSGIYKLNTQTGKLSFYPREKIGVPMECNSFRAWANDKNVWLISSRSTKCNGAIAVYNVEHDKWTAFEESDLSKNSKKDLEVGTIGYSRENFYISHLIGQSKANLPIFELLTYDNNNRSWKKLGEYNDYYGYAKFRNTILKDIKYITSGATTHIEYTYFDTAENKYITNQWEEPEYLAISQRLDNMYYLFAENGVYTLKKNEFPRIYREMNISGGNLGGPAYVDEDKGIAILLGGIGGIETQEPTLGTRLSFQQINIKTGEVIDLLKFNNLSSRKINTLPVKFSNTGDVKIKRNNDMLEIYTSLNSHIMSLNLNNSTIRLQN